MLDHIIGTLYFLHHFDIPHGAVRPASIIVDQEGKYMLADRQLFNNQTNFEEVEETIRNANK
jgi:hypothetical protein